MIWCTTCGAEYAYAKGEERPPCPRAASCDGSGEAGETGTGSTEGNSAVGAAETPQSPTAPQGADLAGLSAALAPFARLSTPEGRSGNLAYGEAGSSDADVVNNDGQAFDEVADDCMVYVQVRAGDIRVAGRALVPTTSAPPAPVVGRDPGLPTDITDALDSFALAVNAMGETVDSRGMPNPDREEIVGQRRAALLAAIRGHIALAHPGSVAPTSGEPPLERVRHKKRGSEYEVLGEAEAQVSAATAESDRFGNWIGLYEGHKLVVYRCVKTGKLWCRSPDEFRDGRFETIAPPPASRNEGGRP